MRSTRLAMLATHCHCQPLPAQRPGAQARAGGPLSPLMALHRAGMAKAQARGGFVGHESTWVPRQGAADECSLVEQPGASRGQGPRLELLKRAGGAAVKLCCSRAAAKGRGGLHAGIHGRAARIAAGAAARAAGGGAVDGAAPGRGAGVRVCPCHSHCSRQAGERRGGCVGGIDQAQPLRHGTHRCQLRPGLLPTLATQVPHTQAAAPPAAGCRPHLVCCRRHLRSTRCPGGPCARRQRWVWSSARPGRLGRPPPRARPPCPSCCCACAPPQGVPGEAAQGQGHAGRAVASLEAASGEPGIAPAARRAQRSAHTVVHSTAGRVPPAAPPARPPRPAPTWRRPPEMKPPSPYRRLPSTTRARPAAELK